MVRKPITLLRFYSNLFQFKCKFPHKISWRLRSEGWKGSSSLILSLHVLSQQCDVTSQNIERLIDSELK